MRLKKSARLKAMVVALSTMLLVGMSPGVASAASTAGPPTHYDFATAVLDISSDAADAGDDVAAENVRVLSNMTDDELREFNELMAAGQFDEIASENCALAPGRAAVKGQSSTTSASTSRKVTASCDQHFKLLGINLVTVRLTGTYYSSQYGARVDRTTRTDSYFVRSFDPTVRDVTFSNPQHSKVNNSLARFSVYVNVARQVGFATTHKGGTFRMTANGYQVVQTCSFI